MLLARMGAKATRTGVSRVFAEGSGKKKPASHDLLVEVSFRIADSDAHSVGIAGSFNDWDARKTPLQKEGSWWEGAVNLPRGRYEYLFVVNGKWTTDPSAQESTVNPFGGNNSVLSV